MMDHLNADDVRNEQRQRNRLNRMRQTLRRSAQRNRRTIEGLACVLGLLIGVALGVIVSSNAPAHRVFDGGRASAAMLP